MSQALHLRSDAKAEARERRVAKMRNSPGDCMKCDGPMFIEFRQELRREVLVCDCGHEIVPLSASEATPA